MKERPDFNKLKLEYLSQPNYGLKEFFANRGMKLPNTRDTRGWVKEHKAQSEKARLRAEAKIKKTYDVNDMLLKNTQGALLRMIVRKASDPDATMQDLVMALKAVRTERGLSNSYTPKPETQEDMLDIELDSTIFQLKERNNDDSDNDSDDSNIIMLEDHSS